MVRPEVKVKLGIEDGVIVNNQSIICVLFLVYNYLPGVKHT